MTTKSRSITSHGLYSDSLSFLLPIVLRPQVKSIASNFCLSTLGSILLTMGTSLAATAQDAEIITDSLPPPPPLSSQGRLVRYKRKVILPVNTNPPTYTSSNQQREYTFTAPKNEVTETNNTVRGYKVEVFDDGEGLLEKVRYIEPHAFKKGKVIQVGIFSQQDNAEDLVRKLAMQGFWARITLDNQ